MFFLLCDGFVHPATRVALQGPGPIIKCSRKPKKDYKYFVRETFSGSENLTRACIDRFGAKRIEDSLDIKKGPYYDLLDKKVYEREKKESRTENVFWNISAQIAGRARRRPAIRADGRTSHMAGYRMRI